MNERLDPKDYQNNIEELKASPEHAAYLDWLKQKFDTLSSDPEALVEAKQDAEEEFDAWQASTTRQQLIDKGYIDTELDRELFHLRQKDYLTSQEQSRKQELMTQEGNAFTQAFFDQKELKDIEDMRKEEAIAKMRKNLSDFSDF